MMVLRILLWLLAVLGGLLGLVVLLLCVPVHFLAEYGPRTRLRLRYGFVTVTLLPGKEKPGKEKPKKKPAESKPKTPLKVRLAELGIPERLPETMDELLLHMLTELVRLADGLRRSLTLHRLRLELRCGGADAAQAAINYGRAWPLLLGVEAALRRVVRLRRFEGVPVLDYAAGKQSFAGSADLSLLPIRAAAACAVHGLRILAGYLRLRKQNRAPARKKGVTDNEQPDL